MKDQLLAAWRKRSPRDRQIISVIAVPSLALILYAYIWLPMNNTRTRLRTELPQLHAQALQMEQDAKEVAHLKALPSRTKGLPLIDIVNQSADRNGIKNDQMQVTSLSAERTQVTLDKVAFDDWIKWAANISTQEGLRIESARINATDTSGVVKISAVFVQLNI